MLNGAFVTKGLTNIVRLPHQPREALGATLAAADLQRIVMGDAASGLAHSNKICSVLESGRPYVFVGPNDSRIVGDVLAISGAAYQVDHGDADALVAAIRAAEAMTETERARIRKANQEFVAGTFGHRQRLNYFAEIAVNGR